MDLFKKTQESYMSPGSLGAKIKRYREIRKLTQKELALKAGCPESSADVRMVQYEKNQRIPKDEVLNRIADALGISPNALFELDLVPLDVMFQILYEIEYLHGLHPVKESNKIYLTFDIADDEKKRTSEENEIMIFLNEWLNKYEEYLQHKRDSEGVREKEFNYILWKAGYPENAIKEKLEKMQDEMKIRELQAEMDRTYAKMKSKETLDKLDKKLKVALSSKHSRWDFSMMSQYMICIKDTMEKGLKIEQHSPEGVEDIDGFCHLFSFKVEDLLSSTDMLALFSELVWGLDNFDNNGIEIRRKITAKDKELYVSYFYPESKADCFEMIRKYWDDMVKIVEKKNNPNCSREQWESLEVGLLKNIVELYDYKLD